jgi:hypothetical protein
MACRYYLIDAVFCLIYGANWADFRLGLANELDAMIG